jgi:hypothetical protein
MKRSKTRRWTSTREREQQSWPALSKALDARPQQCQFPQVAVDARRAGARFQLFAVDAWIDVCTTCQH